MLYAMQEGVRVLAQLPLQSCPVADVALQQLLPKILGYLKKTLQVGMQGTLSRMGDV